MWSLRNIVSDAKIPNAGGRTRCAPAGKAKGLVLGVSLAALGSGLLPVIGRAQDDGAKTVTEAGWVSRRAARGVEWTGPALAGAVELRSGACHARFDAAHPWHSGDPTLAGLGAGYERSAQDEGPSLGVDFRQQWFSRVAAGVTRSTTEAGLQARWTLAGGLKPGLAWWHEFRRRADTVEANLTAEYPLPAWGTYLETDAFAGWVSAGDVRPDAAGPPLRDAYGYAGAGLRLPYRIAGTPWTAVAGLRLSGSMGQNRAWSPLGHPGGAQAGVTLGISYEY